MEDLTKTHLKEAARHYICQALLEAQERQIEQRVVQTIPTRQWEEFDEILETQIERVFRFLGR